MLTNVRIVLVRPSHAGNIGASARAMKTMGLSSLYLVEPRSQPDEQSMALAANAHDVLAKAVLVRSLDAAIHDCKLVIGMSVRARMLQWPPLSPKACATMVVQESSAHPVAILFGTERAGLTNEELQQCHYQVSIPTNPDYSSLNLAMAVQIITYELYTAWRTQQEFPFAVNKTEYPSIAELRYLYLHFRKILQQIGFTQSGRSAQVLQRLRRLMSRARLEKVELNILRGILACIEKNK